MVVCPVQPNYWRDPEAEHSGLSPCGSRDAVCSPRGCDLVAPGMRFGELHQAAPAHNMVSLSDISQDHWVQMPNPPVSDQPPTPNILIQKEFSEWLLICLALHNPRKAAL